MRKWRPKDVSTSLRPHFTKNGRAKAKYDSRDAALAAAIVQKQDLDSVSAYQCWMGSEDQAHWHWGHR
jgi:hypothetical protein